MIHLIRHDFHPHAFRSPAALPRLLCELIVAFRAASPVTPIPPIAIGHNAGRQALGASHHRFWCNFRVTFQWEPKKNPAFLGRPLSASIGP